MTKVFDGYRRSISIPKIHLTHSTGDPKVSWTSGGTKCNQYTNSLHCNKKPNSFPYKKQAREWEVGAQKEKESGREIKQPLVFNACG